MKAHLCMLGLLGMSALPVQAAQALLETVPADLRRDMQTIEGYYDAVRGRQGATLHTPAQAERDPFQVTPELRSRSERRKAAKALAIAAPGFEAGGGEPLPNMRVKALALGARNFAVLSVEEASGKFRDMVVRTGELLQFADSGLIRVRRIDRDGVLLQTGPQEQDVVLLK